jgi:Putative DNA-binding domain
MLPIELDEALLTAVCAEQWPESQTLEFKRDPPGSSEKEKQELLKDVSALANTDGGDLIYGVDEKDGAASAIVPISSEGADELQRRLVQSIEAMIEPRIPGIRFQKIDVAGGYVLALRVPASYSGPHSARVNTARRFVLRNGTVTSDMSYEQLRSAFDKTATLAEAASKMIAARHEILDAKRTPKKISSGPIRALHFIPIAAFSGRQSIDINDVYFQQFSLFADWDWGGASRNFKLEGVVAHSGAGLEFEGTGYALIFRNGACEMVALSGGVDDRNPSKPRNVFFASDVAKWYCERMSAAIQLAKTQELSGPALVSVSIHHVQNHEFVLDRHFVRAIPSSDSGSIVCPQVWIENLETVNPEDVIRESLNILWQAFGLERCGDFDKDTGKLKTSR